MGYALSRLWSAGRAFWLIAATVLFLIGLAIDGTTGVGHHIALISAGICVGCGLRGNKT